MLSIKKKIFFEIPILIIDNTKYYQFYPNIMLSASPT